MMNRLVIYEDLLYTTLISFQKRNWVPSLNSDRCKRLLDSDRLCVYNKTTKKEIDLNSSIACIFVNVKSVKCCFYSGNALASR